MASELASPMPDAAPVTAATLPASSPAMSCHTAAERRIKGWSRAKKEAYIRGDFAALDGFVRDTRSLSRERREADAFWSILRDVLVAGSSG